MWRARRRRQDVTILTETNSVDDVALEVDVVHVESPSTLEAWGLDSKQQAQDGKTGRYIQFVSPRSYVPLKIYKGSGETMPQVVGGNVISIASQTEDEEMVFIEERRNKDSRALWIGICLALVTLIFCIVAYVRIVGG